MKIAILIVLAILGVGSLFGAILSNSHSLAFLGVTGLCVAALVIFHLYNPGSAPMLDLGYRTKKADGSEGNVSVAVKPTALGRPEWAPPAIAPTIRRVDDGRAESEAVGRVRDQLLSILQSGDETTYAQAAEFLQKHPNELHESWKLQVNYANCLIMLGQYESAQQVAEAVLHRFSELPQAEARAHGLLVLCVDGRSPNAQGKLLEELHDQQLRHIERGLQADPTFVDLHLNGFEIKCEQNDLSGAFAYLRNAMLVDPTSTKRGVERTLAEDEELLTLLKEDVDLRDLVTLLGINLNRLSKGEADK